MCSRSAPCCEGSGAATVLALRGERISRPLHQDLLEPEHKTYRQRILWSICLHCHVLGRYT